ncbi:MAG: OsmC family protein [Cyclobacteriaceae bacterium]
MALRKANAEWNGGLKDGKGKMALGSGAYEGPYSFQSRFEDGKGTNPEELIAAAHAGCYSMALTAALEGEGYKPESIKTEAHVSLDKAGEGFAISKIKLVTQAKIPDLSKEEFEKFAQAAKENCPVSKALAATKIELDAKLT